MNTIITILATLFTFPGILFTIGFLALLWWFIFFVMRQRQFTTFAKYWQGTFTRAQNVVGCLVSFTYGLHRYGIRRTATGGMDINPLRVQNWLIAEVIYSDEFFIGHEQSAEYFFKFNFGSGIVHKLITVGDQNYQIGGNSESVIEHIKAVLEASPDLQTNMRLLTSKPWAHLRIKRERNIGRGMVTKMEYIGFPPTFVEKPEELRPYLEALERVLKAVGV